MKVELQNKARLLRAEGKSVKEIADLLGVSKSSVSLWVRDIQLSEEQKHTLKQKQNLRSAQLAGAQANRAKHMKQRVAFQEAGRKKAKEMRPLHLAGCMLYWADGAKRRNIYFANSDSEMHLLFIRFLREELGVKDSEIVVYLHCHTQNPEEIYELEQYWITLLGLSRTNLRKTYIKKGTELKRSVLEHGVCGVGVYRTDLVQHIFGAIQEYAGFNRPGWLF